MNSPIDIVLPWLDDHDPAWQAEFGESLGKYPRDEGADANIHFESWDNLHLWFRAVEKFMPWVRRIVLITWGHVPAFLRTDHEKLLMVRHRDYLPAEYLPTYNSNVIELNVHRIRELADAHKIPWQDEIMSAGSTDSAAIQTSRGGVQVGGVSVPNRYAHSPNSVFNIEDAENVAKLITVIAETEF